MFRVVIRMSDFSLIVLKDKTSDEVSAITSSIRNGILTRQPQFVEGVGDEPVIYMLNPAHVVGVVVFKQ